IPILGVWNHIPSIAVIASNTGCGEAVRSHLAGRISYFSKGAAIQMSLIIHTIIFSRTVECSNPQLVMLHIAVRSQEIPWVISHISVRRIHTGLNLAKLVHGLIPHVLCPLIILTVCLFLQFLAIQAQTEVLVSGCSRSAGHFCRKVNPSFHQITFVSVCSLLLTSVEVTL